MSDPHLTEEGLFSRSLLLGLQSQLPGSNIQFGFMPDNPKEEEPYLTALIEDARRSRFPEGFILVMSTLLMQQLFQESGLPTVVFGDLYPTIQNMPYMNRDQRQAGRLVAEYVLGKGHKRLLMLTRSRLAWGPGEYLVADAVNEVAAKAGLLAGALMNRSLPHDLSIVQSEVQRLLEENIDDPPGILVRPWQMVEAVYKAIESVGLVPQKDVVVAVTDYFDPPKTPLPYPVIRPMLTLEEQGKHIGQLLKHCVENPQGEPEHELIPVRLVVPEE